MAELHVDLRALFEMIRPDFDLASPGLKEAWERGDRDRCLVDTLEEPIRYTVPAASVAAAELSAMSAPVLTQLARAIDDATIGKQPQPHRERCVLLDPRSPNGEPRLPR